MAPRLHSTASDDWHRASEARGMEEDAAALRARHGPALPLVGPPAPPAVHPDFTAPSPGSDDQLFRETIQDRRRALWGDGSLYDEREILPESENHE